MKLCLSLHSNKLHTHYNNTSNIMASHLYTLKPLILVIVWMWKTAEKSNTMTVIVSVCFSSIFFPSIWSEKKKKEETRRLYLIILNCFFCIRVLTWTWSKSQSCSWTDPSYKVEEASEQTLFWKSRCNTLVILSCHRVNYLRTLLS